MKLFRYLAGVSSALIFASAAHAGSIDIVYWGKDAHATVVVDGQTYDFYKSDDWITIKDIQSGAHSLTLYANGASMSRDFTLSRDNADSTDGENGWTWCMDLEDDAANLIDSDTCGDMMDAYFEGW